MYMMQPPKTPIRPHWPLYKSPVSCGTIERVFCCITLTGNPDATFPVDAVIMTVGAVVVAAGVCPESAEAKFDPLNNKAKLKSTTKMIFLWRLSGQKFKKENTIGMTFSHSLYLSILSGLKYSFLSLSYIIFLSFSFLTSSTGNQNILFKKDVKVICRCHKPTLQLKKFRDTRKKSYYWLFCMQVLVDM